MHPTSTAGSEPLHERFLEDSPTLSYRYYLTPVRCRMLTAAVLCGIGLLLYFEREAWLPWFGVDNDHHDDADCHGEITFYNAVPTYEEQVTYDFSQVSGARCVNDCANVANLLPGYSFTMAFNASVMLLSATVYKISGNPVYEPVNDIDISCTKPNDCSIKTDSTENYVWLDEGSCKQNLYYKLAPSSSHFFLRGSEQSGDTLRAAPGLF